MTLVKKARVLVGVLASITLLGLIVANFFYPDLILTDRMLVVLSLLISATLGIDMALKELPINIRVEKNGDQK